MPDQSFWNRWTIGLCEICNDPHSLIDGICYDCQELLDKLLSPVPELIKLYAD